jgi:hypothetical protein
MTYQGALAVATAWIRATDPRLQVDVTGVITRPYGWVFVFRPVADGAKYTGGWSFLIIDRIHGHLHAFGSGNGFIEGVLASFERAIPAAWLVLKPEFPPEPGENRGSIMIIDPRRPIDPTAVPEPFREAWNRVSKQPFPCGSVAAPVGEARRAAENASAPSWLTRRQKAMILVLLAAVVATVLVLAGRRPVIDRGKHASFPSRLEMRITFLAAAFSIALSQVVLGQRLDIGGIDVRIGQEVTEAQKSLAAYQPVTRRSSGSTTRDSPARSALAAPVPHGIPT